MKQKTNWLKIQFKISKNRSPRNKQLNLKILTNLQKTKLATRRKLQWKLIMKTMHPILSTISTKLEVRQRSQCRQKNFQKILRIDFKLENLKRVEEFFLSSHFHPPYDAHYEDNLCSIRFRSITEKIKF